MLETHVVPVYRSPHRAERVTRPDARAPPTLVTAVHAIGLEMHAVQENLLG